MTENKVGDEAVSESEGAEETAAKAAEGDAEKFYPNQDKSPEEIAADKEKGGDETPGDKEEDPNKSEEKSEEENKDEGKPEEESESDKSEEDKSKDAEDPNLVQAEKLEFPEGIDVPESIKNEFTEISNNKDLSPQEKAQALVDLNIKMNAEAFQKRSETWVEQVQSDPKFIGDTGDKLDESLALSKKGMEALNIPGLSKYLVDSGEGNNPLFVEAFMKIGSVVSEDSFVKSPGGFNPEPKSDAEVLYGVKKI